jgi:hypothetical protein
MKNFNENVNQLLEMAYGLGPNSQSISQAQLVSLLLDLDKKGATPFSITQITKQATRKAPYPKFKLSGLKDGNTYFGKVSQVNGMTETDYESNVNTQRLKEELPSDFKSDKGWGEHLTKSVIELEGRLYLMYRPLTSRPAFTPVYVVATDEQGNSFEVISSMEVDKYKSATPEFTKQGVQDKIEIRKISIDGIVAIKIGGEEYVINDLDSTRKAIFDLVQPKG